MSKKRNKRYNSFVTKLGVGFDPVLDVIEAVETLSVDDLTLIPPFNIKKTTEKDYSVELSLPGVKKEDIKAVLDADYLTINAKVDESYDPEGDDVYFYKGIFKGGKFEAKFVIAKNLQFKDAELNNGFLTINFVDKNEKRVETMLAIGPFPKENTDYVVDYNSMGEPVLVPVGEDVNTSVNAVPLAPAVEEPAVVEEAVTVDTVVNSEDTTTTTTVVALPEELPSIVEVKLEDVIADANPTSSEPQATIVVTDATYEISDNVTLEVIKTEEGKADIVVAIPEEVKVEAEAQGIDIIADITAAIEATVAEESVTLPEATVEIESPKIETIEVFEDNETDVKFEIAVPADLPAVVELVETPESTPEAPVLTLDVKTETEISPEAILVPVITPEGQNDIVVAVDPVLHETLVEAGVDIAKDIEAAVIAAEVEVVTTEEPTVTVVVDQFEQTAPAIEVTLPEVLPAVVEIKVEEVPAVLDNVATEPQVIVTVVDATHEIVTDDASLAVIKTEEGQVDVVVAVDKELEAKLEEKGIDILATVQEAFEITPEVTAELVVEPTPEVVTVETETAEVPVELPVELPPVVEVTVVNDTVVVTEVAEIPVEAELTPVVTPEGHSDVVAVVSEETAVKLEELGLTVTEAIVEAVTEVDAGNATEVAVAADTTTVLVNDDTKKVATVEVELPTELPQIVEVSLENVVDVVNKKSEEPQLTVVLTDATYEVESNDATLEVVATPEGSADLIVAIPAEVQAVLDEKKIDIMPAIVEAVKAEEVTAPVLVEAPVEPATVEVTAVVAEELKPETEVTIDVPVEVTPVMSAEVTVTDDLGTTVTLVPTDESVPADSTLVAVVTPEGQNDMVVAVSEEVKAAVEAAGAELTTVLEAAVLEANVEVVKLEETPEVLMDAGEKSDF